jgi:hypothetical protein
MKIGTSSSGISEVIYDKISLSISVFVIANIEKHK